MISRIIIISVILWVPVFSQCDWTGDGAVDVLDIVAVVDCVLTNCFDGSQCDWNDDGDLDVLDIVAMVDCILTGCWNNETPGCTDQNALNFDPQANVDDGSCGYPIAHWNFDEMSGQQLFDVSGNSHHGIISGAEWREGYEGGALHFSDTSYVTVPYSEELQPTGAITIEAVVKLDTILYETGMPIISTNEGGGYGLWNYQGNLDLYIRINSIYYSVEAVTGFETDEWTHIAGTFDGSSLKFYINGFLFDEQNITGDITYIYENSLQIGRDASDGTEPEGAQFYGSVDELRISPIALSPSQFLDFNPAATGCTDPDALNFDPGAVEDDGSCIYDDDYYQREITILYTNDEHGWMVRDNGSGGGAEMMGQWRQVEGYTEEGPFLILSGGDNWTGPAISTWFQGESMVDMMNAMQYDAAAIGNHEFDFGLDGLQSRIDQAEYPYLSANMVLEDSGEPSPLSAPYTIQEVNGVQVGIIGLTTTYADDINFPENVENIDFIDYQGVLTEITPQVQDEGAQVLVVISHICQSEMEDISSLAAELGISLIGGGHCHQLVAENVNGVGLIEGGSYMNSYARAVIDFNLQTNEVENIDVSTHPNEGIYTDPDVAEIVDYWQMQLDEDLSQVIGYLDQEVGQNSDPMFNLITDSWLIAYPADISLTNRGGIRQPMPAGDITMETWVGILPFDNYLVEIELTGQELIDNIGNLVVGGMTTIPDYLLADGTPLDMDESYSILITDYVYATYSNFNQLDPEPYETSIHWRQPVIDWINSLETNPGDPLDNYLDYEPRQ